MKYIGYMCSDNGYVPVDSIGWSESLALVKLFLNGIQYLDKDTYEANVFGNNYTQNILTSSKGNFEDIKNFELNGLLDLSTKITVKESEDKSVAIVTTSSQVDILTTDFNEFSRQEYYDEDMYYNKLYYCIDCIIDEGTKKLLREFTKLSYEKYRILYNYADVDLVKWLVLNDYISPIK